MRTACSSRASLSMEVKFFFEVEKGEKKTRRGYREDMMMYNSVSFLSRASEGERKSIGEKWPVFNHK